MDLRDQARQPSGQQRIQSYAWPNCNTPASNPSVNRTAVAGLLRFWTKGKFISDSNMQAQNFTRSGMDSDSEVESLHDNDVDVNEDLPSALVFK